MHLHPYLNDRWAPLGYKQALGDGLAGRPPIAVPTWITADDHRRLAAYDILGAYRTNTAANYLPDVLDPQTNTVLDQRSKYREYGHGALLVAQARALVLGDGQTITMPGHDGPNQVFYEWLAGTDDEDGWATLEWLQLKLYAMEDNALGDGDGVLALGWDQARMRPRLRKYDPGWYFPDVHAQTQDDFPSTVHVAWEFQDPADQQHTYVQRKTWRLVPRELGAPRLAYQRPGEPPAELTCVFSDGVWRVDRLPQGATVYDDWGQPGRWETPPVDMGIDFIPVVHEANDVDQQQPFGRSILLLIAQVLDDLSLTDSDLQANSSLVGSSPTVTKGAVTNLPAGPGAQWNLPQGADARMLDTSKSLDALLAYDRHLLDTLSRNSRIAGVLLGMVQPDEVESGYLFELGFAPTHALIGELRLIRRMKLPLLLKMTMRMAQVAGVLPAGPTPPAQIELGPYLPADKDGTISRVTKAVQAHTMSVETAVRQLAAAGLDMGEIEEEVARILAEWGELAVQAVEATGDVTAGRRILGLDTPPGAET